MPNATSNTSGGGRRTEVVISESVGGTIYSTTPGGLETFREILVINSRFSALVSFVKFSRIHNCSIYLGTRIKYEPAELVRLSESPACREPPRNLPDIKGNSAQKKNKTERKQNFVHIYLC